MTKLKHIIKHFFKDKDGKWAIIEFPNVILTIWLVLVIINIIITDVGLTRSLEQLSRAALFTWAYIELTRGSSYFRQTFGALVLFMLLISFFK